MKTKLTIGLSVLALWTFCALMVYHRTPAAHPDRRPWNCAALPPATDEERPQAAVERQVCFQVDIDLGLKLP